MDIIEFLKFLTVGVGIGTPLLGGIWFLMSRASIMGANSKKLDMLGDAIAKLDTKIDSFRTEFKEDITKLDAKVDKLDAKVDKLDAKVDGVRMELKEDIAKLDVKIDGVRTELKGDIAKLDTKVDSVRLELKADIANTNVELKTDFKERLAVDKRINLLTQRLYSEELQPLLE
jgi:chromosome segregation ATPase